MEQKQNNLPKVLICAPQHESKNYCWETWINNVNNFTYPKDRLEIFIADNYQIIAFRIALSIKSFHIY